jgi:hypothetical protein
MRIQKEKTSNVNPPRGNDDTFAEDLMGFLGLVLVAKIRGKRKEKEDIDS